MNSPANIEAKSGDTPTIRVLLRNKDGTGIAIPATATAQFRLERISPTPAPDTISVAVVNSVSPADIQYTLTQAQTTMALNQAEPDVYRWEFVVNDVGPPVYQLTGPSQGQGTLTIHPSLATLSP